MMQLYWAPRTRSFTALWLMEETGQPYQRVLTDISAGAQKTPEYLAINPMGKVPALRDGDATLADLTNPDEALDTVVLLDVLEHIEDDVALLARLGARLGPGGHLILKVPAMPCAA